MDKESEDKKIFFNSIMSGNIKYRPKTNDFELENEVIFQIDEITKEWSLFLNLIKDIKRKINKNGKIYVKERLFLSFLKENKAIEQLVISGIADKSQLDSEVFDGIETLEEMYRTTR